MDSITEYTFGVEIEIIAEPRKHSDSIEYKDYYEALANFLRGEGHLAMAEDGFDERRKRPDHYDKWYITSDRSLTKPEPPKHPLGEHFEVL